MELSGVELALGCISAFMSMMTANTPELIMDDINASLAMRDLILTGDNHQRMVDALIKWAEAEGAEQGCIDILKEFQTEGTN